ncbi:MAG TPA: nitroreductase/quinone reductase family protein, partial [bacterium]|nr:nitroreductase/quinone reductase family protein [bacterium]
RRGTQMAQAEFVKALRDREEISITVKGRRSGREVRLPVWFTLEGKTLWLLPMHGARTQWYRNVLADRMNTERAGRHALAVVAHPRRARTAVRRVVEQFRKKYSAELVARYYDHSDAVVEVPLTPRTKRSVRR